MPSEKWKDDKGQKRFRAICHPISLSAGNAIYDAVYTAYIKSKQKIQNNKNFIIKKEVLIYVQFN